MSAPEEIVVTTKSEFLHRMSRALGWHASSKILPGDSITFGGQTVTYRPTSPSDEAREAYFAWMRSGSGAGTYSAFLAGRASVKGAE